jgi:hypothetical protein
MAPFPEQTMAHMNPAEDYSELTDDELDIASVTRRTIADTDKYIESKTVSLTAVSYL